jgi:hypothetical protein
MSLVLSQFVIRVNKQKVINYLTLSLQVCLLPHYNLYFHMYGGQLLLQLVEIIG